LETGGAGGQPEDGNLRGLITLPEWPYRSGS